MMPIKRWIEELALKKKKSFLLEGSWVIHGPDWPLRDWEYWANRPKREGNEGKLTTKSELKTQMAE